MHVSKSISTNSASTPSFCAIYDPSSMSLPPYGIPAGFSGESQTQTAHNLPICQSGAFQAAVRLPAGFRQFSAPPPASPRTPPSTADIRSIRSPSTPESLSDSCSNLFPFQSIYHVPFFLIRTHLSFPSGRPYVIRQGRTAFPGSPYRVRAARLLISLRTPAQKKLRNQYSEA